VPFQTTNSDRKAWTVMLGAFSNGEKIPATILFNGVGRNLLPKLEELIDTDVKIVFTGNGTSSYQNSKTFKFWFEEVLYKNVPEEKRKRTLFLFDQCGSTHKSFEPDSSSKLLFPFKLH